MTGRWLSKETFFPTLSLKTLQLRQLDSFPKDSDIWCLSREKMAFQRGLFLRHFARRNKLVAFWELRSKMHLNFICIKSPGVIAARKKTAEIISLPASFPFCVPSKSLSLRLLAGMKKPEIILSGEMVLASFTTAVLPSSNLGKLPDQDLRTKRVLERCLGLTRLEFKMTRVSD